MSLIPRWRRRLRALFRKTAVDREMDDEMRFHLEMEAEEAVHDGMAPAEARRRAMLVFGGVQRFREEGREARGIAAIEDLGMDLRYAARTLLRSPAFTIVAVLTLALGIGANTAIFSVVNAVLLRPLPYDRPQMLMSVWDGGHSKAEFTRVRDQNRTLERVAAYMDRVGFSVSGDGEPARLTGAYVSADLFGVLGAHPALGNTFAPGDDLPGTDRAVVLSDALWRERFGADIEIIGRRLDLDGVSHTVVGVMPRDFWFPRRETRLWVPVQLNESIRGDFWGSYGHFIVGRLRAGVTREQVREDVRAIGERLRLENPVWTPTDYYLQGLDVIPLASRIVPSESRRLLLVLLGAVGMVLFIACANVANLLIARGTAREREITVRATLGAARPRLIRQLATESLALAGVGAVAGLGLAFGGVRLLVGLLPPETPRLADVSVSGGVLLYTAGLAVLAGLLFGLVPALRLSGPDLAASLGDGGTRSGTGIRQRRLAGVLVAGEIALSVVLAVGAGLLLRSFARILAVDPGFRTEHMVTARVSPPKARWTDPEQHRRFYQELLDRLRGSPAIAAAGITNQAPFEQTNDIMAMWVDGYTTNPNELEVMNHRKVTPGFFDAMGVPLVRGRWFGAGDRANAPPVALIDEAAAQRYWSGKDPVGGRLRYPWPGWVTIVGVVRTVKNNDLTDQPTPTVYVPFEQAPLGPSHMTVVARAASSPVSALAALRAAVRELAPDVPVSDERTMTQRIGDSVAQPRFASLLLLSFGALALVLGAVGTYGLMAYTAQRRTREIAVRMALGARARDVLGAVVGEGARLAAAGVIVGLAMALALTRFLRGMLFEVSPTDPLTFVVVPLVLGAVALLASYLPARRATRVDPMIAIRTE
jgi:predicted permease